jgi:glycosyltransferase involved in cell wall biosynthesis
MKVGIYSPYLDTAGGGEKYILTIAECLSETEQVDVFLDAHLEEIGIEKIKTKIEKLHGLDLTKINFIAAPFGKSSSLLKRLIFLKKYDWLFFLTDGSLFLSTAKKSIIHFQVPFENTTAKSAWGKRKLKSWDLAIYNSNFTKEIVEKSWSIKGKVIYPPVSVDQFKPLKKHKQILSVGRFFGYLKDKKHSVLIQSFKNLIIKGELKNWSLNLVGGMGEGDQIYLNELRKEAHGFNINFYPNASLKQLKKLYGQASIYWHAAGFEETDPKKFEHFGITTVEAMAAGCVPMVVNKGGLKEIVVENCGFTWDDLIELENITVKLVNDKDLRGKIAQNAIERSNFFNKDKFTNNIKTLIYD